MQRQTPGRARGKENPFWERSLNELGVFGLAKQRRSGGDLLALCKCIASFSIGEREKRCKVTSHTGTRSNGCKLVMDEFGLEIRRLLMLEVGSSGGKARDLTRFETDRLMEGLAVVI